jgi:hypothetical protein
MQFSIYEPSQDAYISYSFISQKWYKNGVCYPTNQFRGLYLTYADNDDFVDMRKRYSAYRLRSLKRSKGSIKTSKAKAKGRSNISKDIFG